jgi:hypothetical protein
MMLSAGVVFQKIRTCVLASKLQHRFQVQKTSSAKEGKEISPESFLSLTMMKHVTIFTIWFSAASAFTGRSLVPSRPSLLQCAVSRESVDAEMAARSRRDVIFGLTAVLVPLALGIQPANAIPMVTADEFYVLIRDSALSVQVVEFSGPKSETVVVRLVDGTSFGIKDIIESPVDPRSPLKVAAECRENNVKTRFVDFESVLAKAPRKSKLYTNQRVQDAAEKEREKMERMRLDEEERLAALLRMEQEEEAAARMK